ncbi:MAG: protein translocase subunit SecF, partial [Lachnospiraceae bacterium]|nr:protein translocase subunit SecF [Lachnospiraceae bacterium]
VLMIFGSGTMLSFGYTLLVGVIVNCFIGVNVSRWVLKSLLEYPACDNEKNFRKKTERKTIHFFENRKKYAIVVAVIFIIGLVGIGVRGIHLDTQFEGGTVLEYRTEAAADVSEESIAAAVEKAAGRAATIQMTESNVDSSTALVVTLAGKNGVTPETQKDISEAIAKELGLDELEPSQTFAVEPYIGAKAMRNGIIAVLVSFACILAYVGLRFSVLSGLSAGLTAIIALLNDVCVVLFVFTIFGIPLGDSFVAVVLTIIGYSINDTIVVYDRIRENTNMNPGRNLIETVDESLTQVLARSINTSVTTGICVIVILISSVLFRISSIYRFSLPMFFGLINGTFSSICVASILWAVWKQKKQGVPATDSEKKSDGKN